MSEPLDKHLVKAIACPLVFIGLADDETLNPDAGRKAFECISHTLTRMIKPYQTKLGEQFKALAAEYIRYPEVAKYLKNLPELLGLGRSERSRENGHRDRICQTTSGPFDQQLVNAIAYALAFIALADEDTVQPDSGCGVLEGVHLEIHEMSKADQITLGAQFKTAAAEYAHDPRTREYIETLPEVWEFGQDEGE